MNHGYSNNDSRIRPFHKAFTASVLVRHSYIHDYPDILRSQDHWPTVVEDNRFFVVAVELSRALLQLNWLAVVGNRLVRNSAHLSLKSKRLTISVRVSPRWFRSLIRLLARLGFQ